MDSKLALYSLLSFVCICNSAVLDNTHSQHSSAKSSGNKLLLVSFDGVRYDYPDRDPDLEGFRFLEENGVHAKYLKPVFPTQTSPNHFSIATGLYTESHGVVHNVKYDIESGRIPTGSFYSTLIEYDWWDNGAEPIWTTVEKQGFKAGSYMFPGSAAPINGQSITKLVYETRDTAKDEVTWGERIDETLDWFISDDLDFAALYFEEPDSSGHNYGPDDSRIKSLTLPLISRTIMKLFTTIEELGLKDTLDVIIVSSKNSVSPDHGMNEILKSREETISLWEDCDRNKTSFMYSYGPLGLVEPLPEYKQEVYEQLKNGNPHMDVYLKEDIPERFHYKNNDRVTSIVVFSHPGYSVYNQFVFHVNTGEHGYDNELDNMKASYWSVGPSFKKGYRVDGFENVNVYPLMCYLLGLDAAPNNGSLAVLSETLSGSETECNGNLRCGPNAFCIPLPEEDECRCSQGFTGDAYDEITGCLDIDECLDPASTDACNELYENTVCENKEGGYSCVCAPGFEGDPELTGICYAIVTTLPPTTYIPDPETECDQNLQCGPNTNCRKYGGPDECRCIAGYEGDAYDINIGCTDIDECDPTYEFYRGCAENAYCENTVGSYRCYCDDGFVGDPNGYGCYDPFATTQPTTMKSTTTYTPDPATECNGNLKCGPGAFCIPLPEEDECRCSQGFVGDPYDEVNGCLDVNECEDTTLCTNPNTFCENLPGSYQCSCDPGFEGDPDSAVGCAVATTMAPTTTKITTTYVPDVDTECNGNLKCGPGAFCIPLPQEDECRCSQGFVGDPYDEVNGCLDVNECVDTTLCTNPNTLCENLPGSYQCSCDPGFEGNPDSALGCAAATTMPPTTTKITTTYVPEPDTECNGNLKCGPGAFCIPLPQEDECRCSQGFEAGDPYDEVNGCLDIDECVDTTLCNNPNTFCENLPGSYQCSCDPGFEGDPDNALGCAEATTMAPTTTKITTTYVPEPDTECNGNLKCGPGAFCIPLPQEDECRCSKGYKGGDPYDEVNGCLDIDECVDTTLCTNPNTFCENLPGSYQCSCDPGFEGDPDSALGCAEVTTMGPTTTKITTTYVPDVDTECNGNLKCGPGAFCIPLPQEDECRCSQGFEGGDPYDETNGCLDIDECVDTTLCTNPNTFCENLPGSYQCSCDPGFEGDPDSALGCAVASTPAPTTTPGSTTPSTTYVPDIETECNGYLRCGPEAFCIPLPQQDECRCNSGFEGDPYEPVYGCLDRPVEPVPIDFQMTFDMTFDAALNDPSSQMYLETSAMSTEALKQILNTTSAEVLNEEMIVWTFIQGSVIAMAEEVEVINAFSVADVQQQLTDFDASTVENLQTVSAVPAGSCNDGTLVCGNNSHCHAKYGNDGCFCTAGYEGDPYIGCTDEDECDPANEHYRGCAANAYCQNTIGLYECICNDGYEGDPNNYGCFEINGTTTTMQTTTITTTQPTTYITDPATECDGFLECGPNTNCMKYGGPDECHCRAGYEGDPYDTNIGCTDINECDPNSDYYVECARNAHCVNTIGMWRCECDDGFDGDPNNYGCWTVTTTESTTTTTSAEETEPTVPPPTEPVPEVIGYPNFFGADLTPEEAETILYVLFALALFFFLVSAISVFSSCCCKSKSKKTKELSGNENGAYQTEKKVMTRI